MPNMPNNSSTNHDIHVVLTAPSSGSVARSFAEISRHRSATGLKVPTESSSSSTAFLDASLSSSPPSSSSDIVFLLTVMATTLTMFVLTLSKLWKHLHRDPFPQDTSQIHNQTRSKQSSSKKTPFKPLPPCHVSPHPLLGHMPQVSSPPDSALYQSIFLDHADPSSGLSTFWFLSTPCLAVLKAEHARSILRHSVERKTFDIFTRHFKRSLGKDSLVIMEGGGGTWRHHRNLVKAAFTEKAVRNMSGSVWEVASRFARSILDECDADEEGSIGCYAAEALDIFKWATIDVFGQVALGHDFECTSSLSQTPVAASFDATVEDSSARTTARNLFNPMTQWYWLPTERNREYAFHSGTVRRALEEICERKVEDVRSKESGGEKEGKEDMLAILLKSDVVATSNDDQSQSQSKQTPNACRHGEMIEMLMTLFFAGYDTSSIGLSMAMYEVSEHPRIQSLCAEEARRAADHLVLDPTQWEDRLAYNWAVVMETLRLHPPVFTNCRNLVKDVELDEYTVPSGTRVYIPVVQIHTDERNFGKRAKEFLPERWVRWEEERKCWVKRDYAREEQESQQTRERGKQGFTQDPKYIPAANPNYLFSFSDGARNCVGKRLALQESTMLLSCILRDLTVQTREGYVLQKRKKFAMAPPTEMPLRFKRREWD